MNYIEEKYRPERYRPIEKAKKYDEKIHQAKGSRKLSSFLELRAVRKALVKIDGDSILDAPCGTGRIDGLLRSRFKNVTGLDSSEAMLEIYNQAFPEREGYLGNIFELPFPDKRFDWVICHRLFHHLNCDEDRLKLLKSISRVSIKGIILYAWIKTPFGSRRKSHRKTITYQHMVELFNMAGLNVHAIHYAAWPFQPKAMLICQKTVY